MQKNQSNENDEEDWRNFRAKLVMQYRQEESGISSPNLDRDDNTSSSLNDAWAYESGDTIEKGSIVLSRHPEEVQTKDPESGLTQQYFHKSIILVLDHIENVYTKGIILNRPTNLLLSDDDFVNADGSPLEGSSQDNKWKVWFGGEVNGILSDDPEIICLHSLDNEFSDQESNVVMKGIKWTSLEGARKIVQSGHASASDFLTFIGYCGWDAGQLVEELDKESWYMVAADSTTLLEELKKNNESDEILDAGLDSWRLLMSMIGKHKKIPDEKDDSFEDLMLKEWTKERLLYPTEEEGDQLANQFLSTATASKSFGTEVRVGSVLRSSASLHYNPFLLSDQEYHKSILLMIQDDDDMSVGVILNMPSSSTVSLEFTNERTGVQKSFMIPERYGGRFSEAEEEEVMLWFHCNDELKSKGIGNPLDDTTEYSIWSISPDDAANVIATGEATAEDFIVVSGLSVWEKAPGGIAGGIQGEVNNHLFEIVPPENIASIFDILLQQEPMKRETIDDNINYMDLAWSESLSKDPATRKPTGLQQSTKIYKSDVTISDLADVALKRWISAFLLQDE